VRDIIFRAKDHLEGRWQYGAFGNRNGHATIYTGNGLKFPVHGDTVGQYTGLNDSEGKMIFEGDIVSYHHAEYTYVSCLIKYEPAKAGFCLVALYDDITTNKEFEKGDVMSLYIPMADIEVIGNIHDNPELTEGF
jgi:uncharacterized phage protein (TIGR01671 family)